MTQRYYKICPRCGRQTDLDTAACAGCGRIFRTQFGSPVTVATPAADASPRQDPVVRRLIAVLIAFMVVSLLVLTNPTEQDLARAVQNFVHDGERSPEDGWELFGRALADHLTPAAVGVYFERRNYFVCSVFVPRYNQGFIIVGAGQRLWRIPPLTEAEKRAIREGRADEVERRYPPRPGTSSRALPCGHLPKRTTHSDLAQQTTSVCEEGHIYVANDVVGKWLRQEPRWDPQQLLPCGHAMRGATYSAERAEIDCGEGHRFVYHKGDWLPAH